MIIWGRKRVTRPLGFVADFCPICACARPFALQRVGMAGHVYFITAGDGDLVGFERSCLVCTIALKADPTHYTGVAKAPDSVADLVVATNPHFQETYSERLALENNIRANPLALSPQDRLSMIMTPFVLLSPKVTARFETTQFDPGGKFVRNEVMPILVRALRRLRPTAKELQTTLARLAQLKELIGTKVKLKDLIEALGAGVAPSDTNAAWTLPTPQAQINTGRLLRIASYLLCGSLVLLAALLFWPGKTTESSGTLLVLMLAMAPLGYGMYRAGHAVAQGKAWGRNYGIAVGLVMLMGFPVGSLVGAYILWNLVLRWNGEAKLALGSAE